MRKSKPDMRKRGAKAGRRSEGGPAEVPHEGVDTREGSSVPCSPMGRLWVVVWTCLLVVGFALEARAGDPGFLPVRVCVRPQDVPATAWVWGYRHDGRVLTLLTWEPLTRERFMETSYPYPIYIFDPNAPAANTKRLPDPHNNLPCAPKPPAEKEEVTEPLSRSPPVAPEAETKNEAKTPPPQSFVSPTKAPEPRPRLPNRGVTTDWWNTVLPIVCPSASRTPVLPTRTVLPMRGRSSTGGARTLAATTFDEPTEEGRITANDTIELDRWRTRSGRCDGSLVAAPVAGLKKPEPPPPGGKDYAASKAIELARQAAQDADRLGAELGGRFGKTLGDAQEALKTLNRLTAGALPRILKSNPGFVDGLQSGLANKLNAIPALPVYADAQIAEIARKGFERGFGAGLAEAKLKATAVYVAAEAALALSGSAAIVAERAGATALRAALARLKGMPIFIPGAIEGGGAIFRLPKSPIAQAPKGGGKIVPRATTSVGGTVDDILAGSARTNPGRLRPGRAAQFERPGGFNQANADFAGLNPANIADKGGGIRVGQLSDGRTIIVRPGSTQGLPTLEIQGGANPIKIRFTD